jgi:hypothetical protein
LRPVRSLSRAMCSTQRRRFLRMIRSPAPRLPKSNCDSGFGHFRPVSTFGNNDGQKLTSTNIHSHVIVKMQVLRMPKRMRRNMLDFFG